VLFASPEPQPIPTTKVAAITVIAAVRASITGQDR
jgi:hypothetical protein